jgi:hypothetical protein
MIESGQSFCLAFKAIGKRRMPQRFHRQDFQSDESIQSRLAGLVNNPHSTPAQQFGDFQLRKMRR